MRMVEEIKPNSQLVQEGAAKTNTADKVSIESIKAMKEGLKGKVAQAEEEKQRHIEKMLADLDGLALERKDTSELTQAATETRDYYSEMDKAGKLDENDKSEFQRIKDLLVSLESHKTEIQKSISNISSNPDIKQKLLERQAAEQQAHKEEFERQKEGVRGKLYQDADSLVASIGGFANQLYELDKKRKDALDKYREAEQRAQDFAKEKMNEAGFGGGVPNTDKPEYYEDFFKRIKERRGELSILKIGKKAAVDELLANKSLFEEANKKYQEFKKVEEEVDNEKKDVNARCSELKEKRYELLFTLGNKYGLYHDVLDRMEHGLRQFVGTNKEDAEYRRAFRNATYNIDEYWHWEKDDKEKAK